MLLDLIGSLLAGNAQDPFLQVFPDQPMHTVSLNSNPTTLPRGRGGGS
jgi:hypothetical protein